MDYYEKEFLKLQEEFHEVMHKYPLFKETIEEIEEKDIKEINELLEKNDEFYLKKAITKLTDLIKYVKDLSITIDKEYKKFDILASKWEKIRIINVSDKELANVNNKVHQANDLIKSHDVKEIKEANKIMELLIKEYE